jgi:hypothetical protein
MNHHGAHATVEIVGKTMDGADNAVKVARAIAASEAFRKYDWVRNAPVRNLAGNFRGMVLSSRWAAAYHFAESGLEVVEKVAVVAAIAVNIANASEEIEGILRSKDSWDTKAARLSTQVSSISTRTLLGVIPAGTSMLAVSLGGYCQLADLAGLHKAAQWNEKLKSMAATVTTTFDKVTDGNTMYTFINNHLVIK